MENIFEKDKEWLDKTFEKVDNKLKAVAARNREKIPYTAKNGVFDDRTDDINWWTNGFFGGMMWLMYSQTHNEEYKKTAISQEEKMDAALKNFDKLHHDVGFMWHILSGANYRLTGDKNARLRNLYAATTLFSRYNISGGFIQAWNNNEHTVDVSGWSIIDCMMNIPQLYWASEELLTDSFKKVAMSHADMAIRDHIRKDGSVNHIVEHNTQTGEVVKIHAGQGYDENSCWSRGLAWAIYGSVLSYIYTKKQDYLDAAIKTADYFIENVKKTNYKTVVDFTAPSDPCYFDSTAGLCTACGLLELNKIVTDKNYANEAINILKATDEFFADYSLDTDCLTVMGTERYPHNQQEAKGVHIPIIYGDFFYVEALLKLKGNEFLIW